MNSIQKHLVVLLKEIDEICAKNNIDYVLCGRTAKDACKDHTFLGEYVYASVLMNVKDFLKFRRVVKQKFHKKRVVESIMDYPDYPEGRAMRYVDEETTFLYGHTAHRFRHNGIFVTIQQCRCMPKGALAKKAIKVLDDVINFGTKTSLEGMGKKKRFALKCLKAVGKLMGNARLVRMAVRIQNMFLKRKGNSLTYIRVGSKDISLAENTLRDVKCVVFGEESFAVPQSHDEFIKKVFGVKWASDDQLTDITTPHLLVASTEVSYKEFDIGSVLGDRSRIERMMEVRNSLSSEISAKRKQIEKNWDVLFMTRERYRLYTQFKPIEDALYEKVAKAKAEYEWLSFVLQDYTSSVKEYLIKGWPIQVSPKLDAVVMEMLRYNGEKDYVESFKKQLNEKNLNPITIDLEEKLKKAAVDSLHNSINEYIAQKEAEASERSKAELTEMEEKNTQDAMNMVTADANREAAEFFGSEINKS